MFRCATAIRYINGWAPRSWSVLLINIILIFYPYKMNKSSMKNRFSPATVDWTAAGRRIRELRGFDLTQEEFARRIGVSQNYLSMMERGRVQIGAEILLTIGQQTGKSIEWILTGEG